MAFKGLNSLIAELETQTSWQTRRQFRQIVDHWPKAVGYVVARQTRPLSLQRQVLFVATSTSAWAQTLMFERQRIVDKLNNYLQISLKDIRFSTAQWSASPSRGLVKFETAFFKDHPSYIGLQNQSDPKTSKQAQNLTAYEAFQHWSARIQAQQKKQAICPSCNCPCPPGEIERWRTCSLCAAKTWSRKN